MDDERRGDDDEKEGRRQAEKFERAFKELSDFLADDDETQDEKNRKRIGELAMRFMDSLDDEFEQPILGDVLILADVITLAKRGTEYVLGFEMRYDVTSTRPVIVGGLLAEGQKMRDFQMRAVDEEEEDEEA